MWKWNGVILFSIQTELSQIHRQVSLRSLTAFFFDRFAMGERWGGYPGNGIVAQALLSVSRRSACLQRPLGAASSGPKPAQWREPRKLT